MSSTIWHRTWSGTGLSVIIISLRKRSKGRSMIRGGEPGRVDLLALDGAIDDLLDDGATLTDPPHRAGTVARPSSRVERQPLP
jgi:hypothetical protein